MPPYHALSVSGNQGCTPFLPGLCAPVSCAGCPSAAACAIVSIICHHPFLQKKPPAWFIRSGSRLPRSLPLLAPCGSSTGKGITDKGPEPGSPPSPQSCASCRQTPPAARFSDIPPPAPYILHKQNEGLFPFIRRREKGSPREAAPLFFDNIREQGQGDIFPQ